MNSKFQAWIISTRPKTLIASISPLFLVTVLLIKYQSFDLKISILSAICIIGLQVLVNFLNDYFDISQGVDQNRKGPLRGMHFNLISKKQMLLACSTLALGIAGIGIYLILLTKTYILFFFGLLSLFCAFLYSFGKKSIANLALGELVVFFFYGPVAVVGVFYLQANYIKPIAFYLSLPLGFAISAIMLVNNIRDIKTDLAAKKFTLATRIGQKKAIKLYQILILISFFPLVIFFKNFFITTFFMSCFFGILFFLTKNLKLEFYNKTLALTSFYSLAISFCYSFFIYF